MASLGGGAGSVGLPQPSPPLSDPAIVSHSLGGSGSLGPLAGGQQDAAQPSPVIMPPSAQQVGLSNLQVDEHAVDDPEVVVACTCILT